MTASLERLFRSIYLLSWFLSIALLRPRFRRGQSVVPSEDYSHAPPAARAFWLKGDRPKPNRERFLKKTMKTQTNSLKKSGLQNRPELANSKKLPKIDLAARRSNRRLPTEKLLALMRVDTPQFFNTAEVVGAWVWIKFDQKQPQVVTRELSELGFHWNGTRQTWQHPCGAYRNQRANYDPRQRYGSYFAARKVAASSGV